MNFDNPLSRRYLDDQTQIIVSAPDVIEARKKIDLYRAVAELPPLKTAEGVKASPVK